MNSLHVGKGVHPRKPVLSFVAFFPLFPCFDTLKQAERGMKGG